MLHILLASEIYAFQESALSHHPDVLHDFVSNLMFVRLERDFCLGTRESVIYSKTGESSETGVSPLGARDLAGILMQSQLKNR